MHRRRFLGTALMATIASPLGAALRAGRWDDAAEVLARATRASSARPNLPSPNDAAGGGPAFEETFGAGR